MKELLYLSFEDVARVGPEMPDLVDLLRRVFEEKGAGRADMPPKPAIHPREDAFLHAMPAFVPALGAMGVKWVAGYPTNRSQGLPYILGLIVLNDPATGEPLSVMDARWITAQRTAAATVLAARFLAQEDADSLGILGCGTQGRAHLFGLAPSFPLRHVRLYDPDEAASQRLAAEATRRLRLDALAVRDPRAAVTGCALIVTAGPILRKPHATIGPDWMDEGAFASLVDFDSSWQRAALHQVDKWCSDDRAQLEHYKGLGYFRDVPTVYAELADLVLGLRPGRESPRERTMACNLGLGIEDVAVASCVYGRALDQGVGTWLPA